MKPESNEAVKFLRSLRPEGPWAVTAIPPEGGGITTRTFTADQGRELFDFVAEHNGESNLYYALNPPVGVPNKKATKADIARAEFLHVDVDPLAGEDLTAERVRIQKLVSGAPPEGVPLPSFVVDSGGGFQLLWRLREPVPVHGDEAAAAEIERRNIGLANLYGGDHCHNIDRVLRLPGTVNIPNAKKRAKGRVDAPALLTSEFPNSHPLDIFPSAPRDVGPARGPYADAVTTPAASAPIEDLDTLDEYNVPGRVKVIINQGRDLEKPKQGDNSRSAWLFDVCCQLVRSGVPDSVVLGILLDEGWGISESVLENNNPEKYARRQIAKAREEVARDEGGSAVVPITSAVVPIAEDKGDWLAEMNGAHAVLLQEGGKTRVLSWEISELDYSKRVPVLQTFEDFRNRYCNKWIEVGVDAKGQPVRKQQGHQWLLHDRRRQHKALRFAPGRPAEFDGYLNLWRGFAVEPVAGDWSKLREHIVEVIADGDEASADYILRWLAWSVQNPAEPAEVALVLKGGRGCGKGTVARAIKRIFGQHGLQVTSPTQITGRFNAHLRAVCLLFADEAIAPGDKVAESALKGFITEPELPIEGKGVDTIQTRNHLHIVMASNNDWVVPAGPDERRFAVFQANDSRVGDHQYFAAITQETKGGGLAAMLYDLLEMDLGRWHPRLDVPQTAALAQQQDNSMPDAQQVVHDMLLEGEPPCLYGVDSQGSDTVFVATQLLMDATRTKLKDRRALGIALRVVAGGGRDAKLNLGEGLNRRRYRGQWLLPLSQARTKWGQHLGRETDWSAGPKNWNAEPMEAPDEHNAF